MLCTTHKRECTIPFKVETETSSGNGQPDYVGTARGTVGTPCPFMFYCIWQHNNWRQRRPRSCDAQAQRWILRAMAHAWYHSWPQRCIWLCKQQCRQWRDATEERLALDLEKAFLHQHVWHVASNMGAFAQWKYLKHPPHGVAHQIGNTMGLCEVHQFVLRRRQFGPRAQTREPRAEEHEKEICNSTNHIHSRTVVARRKRQHNRAVLALGPGARQRNTIGSPIHG